MRSLAYDFSMIIKMADKGSCVVVWDRSDCIVEAEKQLGDKKDTAILVMKFYTFSKMFRSLKCQGKIIQKELK